MSKKPAKAKDQPKTEWPEEAINCPVIGCRRNLRLQPHPTLAGRVVALCDCPKKDGLAVYETDETNQILADQEENNGST
jgi:hypothetical protein